MATDTYWLTLDATRGHVDAFVNDVPALRLGPLGGRRVAIKEYLRRGPNTVTLKAARFIDPRAIPPGDAIPSEVSLKLERLRFEGETRTEAETLFERTARGVLVAGAPGAIMSGAFPATPAHPMTPLTVFEPMDAAAQALVRRRLDTVARWWAAGDAEAIVEWLGGYIRDYTADSPVDTPASYAERFKRFVKAYAPPNAQVEYRPEAVDLALCGEGRLADTLAGDREGAAIRLRRDRDDYHDFHIVVGVRQGVALAFR